MPSRIDARTLNDKLLEANCRTSLLSNGDDDVAAGEVATLDSELDKLAPWLFLAPGMIFFVIYVTAPIIQSIWI